MLKILLADDHAVVREGLKRLIAQHFGGCTVAEATNGHEALATFDKNAWDLVLLDIGLPGRSGLEVLREMKLRRPEVRVLIFSALAENELGQRILKSGGSGFLAKENCAEELVRAIRKVLAGGRYISANLAEHLALNLGRTAVEPHETLSDREYVVFKMIGNGSSVTEIAHSLCLSPKTITTYRAHILHKMSMSTNADMIRYAVKNHIVE
jgi:two-component system, NarL family, invasion response regulator UvrY